MPWEWTHDAPADGGGWKSGRPGRDGAAFYLQMAVHQAETRRFPSRSRIFVPRVWRAGADVSCARVSFTQC